MILLQQAVLHLYNIIIINSNSTAKGNYNRIFINNISSLHRYSRASIIQTYRDQVQFRYVTGSGSVQICKSLDTGQMKIHTKVFIHCTLIIIGRKLRLIMKKNFVYWIKLLFGGLRHFYCIFGNLHSSILCHFLKLILD